MATAEAIMLVHGQAPIPPPPPTNKMKTCRLRTEFLYRPNRLAAKRVGIMESRTWKGSRVCERHTKFLFNSG